LPRIRPAGKAVPICRETLLDHLATLGIEHRGLELIGAAGTALARGHNVVYLKRGDSAATFGGETACTAMPHGGSRLGFVCRLGGDYRAAYGVIINEREAAITQYTGFSRYRVLVRKVQHPIP
jgi:hypothetical protein